ncbi:MAG: hypothetical protein ABIF08_00070, partial [Nanoarchaeota archaeon]
DDVWQSTDLGENWTKINDDYNGEGQHIKTGIVDSDDNVFIIEGDEDVWKSSDGGLNWTKTITNFNSDNGNAKGMAALLLETGLTFQARSCALANCSDGSFSGSYADSSGENLSVSDNRYFQYQADFTSNSVSLSAKLYNVSVDYTLLVSDEEAPVITLISPADSSGDIDGNITFSYNVTDSSDINNCFLIIGGEINQTDSSVTKNMIQEFTTNNLAALNYEWSINCTDSEGNIGSSKSRQFSVILTTEFSGNTTDLSSVDVSNIAGLIIENSSAGKIMFQEAVNLSSGADIDGNVNIAFNSIQLNANALTALNKPANVHVYNLNYTDPRPVLNGEECPDSVCTEISYENGMFVFSVLHFSTYSAEETPDEETDSGSNDAETPSSPSDDKSNCFHEWECTSWEECETENIQTRTCTYTGTCSDQQNKPEEIQSCTYTVPELEKEELVVELKPSFDMLLEIPAIYKDISVEDALVAVIKLTDVELSGKSNVIIEFKIIDENSNILLEISENVVVENKANLFREIALPESIESGLYKLEVTLLYGDDYKSKVVGSDTFNVTKIVRINYNYATLFLFIITSIIIYIAFKSKIINYLSGKWIIRKIKFGIVKEFGKVLNFGIVKRIKKTIQTDSNKK